MSGFHYWTLKTRKRLHENREITVPLRFLYVPLTQNTVTVAIHYSALVQTLTGTSAASDAAHVLAQGSLLLLPTETVYGLAANAENAAAVHRIFTVKDRPQDHPLIVHIARVQCLDYWATRIPDYARDLAAAFWPGPMTLVLNRSDAAGDFITGGQDTVALRIPGHPLAREIITHLGAETGSPCAGVAAPSANRFGRVSPTTLEHAQRELGDYLEPTDAGVDGGPADIGIESTIIDCTGDSPTVLRRGAVTEHDIASIAALSEKNDSTVRAPGMLAAHYAPTATVRVVHDTHEIDPHLTNCCLLAPIEVTTPAGVTRLGSPRDAHDYARVLYTALRHADQLNADTIYVIAPSGSGIAAAVRDRITRAAHRD